MYFKKYSVQVCNVYGRAKGFTKDNITVKAEDKLQKITIT